MEFKFYSTPILAKPCTFFQMIQFGSQRKTRLSCLNGEKKRRPEIPYLGITADVVVVTYVYLIAVLGVCNRIFSPEKKGPYKLKFL